MTVWLCSGQGAQKPGMGVDLLVLPEVAETFDIMSKIMGINLSDLAKDGTAEEISEPIAAQALTMAVSVGVGKALQARGFEPDAVIGFSLGQISGLVLSGVLSLEDATALLKVRAASMAEECEANPGAMLALMGADVGDAMELCAESSLGQVLVVANYNAPGQIVISGEMDAIERAENNWKGRKGKCVRLATAGGFHSALMSGAGLKVKKFCEDLDFAEPAVPLICNTDAKPFVVEEAAKRLGEQVRSGVKFEQSVRSLIDQGETDFVEVGFGGVLMNLVKRIDKETTRHAIGTLEQFNAYVEGAE